MDGPPGSVFITGASGFIGRVLADRYRERGAEVRGVDLNADASAGVVAGDIALPGDWRRAVEGCELVINTAANVSPRSAGEGFWEANVVGVRNVIDAAIAGGARRFVQLSSIVVFGNEFPDGVDERYPVRPLGVPYVDTKIAGEQVTLAAHAAGEIDCTVVRPGDVYGPRARTWVVLPIELIKSGRFMLPAGGRGLISPVYVDNLVDGIELAGSSASAVGQVITIADGTTVPTAEFFELHHRLLRRRGPRTLPTALARAIAASIDRGSRLARADNEVNAYVVDYLARTSGYSNEKARSLLGYEPKVSLEEGLRRTGEWIRQSGLV